MDLYRREDDVYETRLWLGGPEVRQVRSAGISFESALVCVPVSVDLRRQAKDGRGGTRSRGDLRRK